MKYIKNPISTGLLILALSIVFTACQSEIIHAEKSHQAQTFRKAGPVEISGTAPKHIAVSSYADVVLSFTLTSPRDVVSVTVQPSAGLTVAGAVDHFTLGIVDAGAVEDKVISVSAEIEGLYHLNVFVETQRGDAKSVQTAACRF
jgi:hypothetical protein